MAYQGYLIRLKSSTAGNYDISPSMIKLNTYKVTWEGQDWSAFRTSDGYLKRKALDSRPPKVEFQVRNGMTNTELSNFMGAIRTRLTSKTERKYTASIYIPEINGYVEDEVYMVDPEFSIYRIDGSTIYYNSFRMAFIGYGSASSWSNA